MPKTGYFYKFIAPVDEEVHDDVNRPPILTMPAKLENGPEWEVAILGTPNTIKMVRVKVPDIEGDSISVDDLNRCLRVASHALHCIRLSYDPAAEYFQYQGGEMWVHNVLPEETGPDLHLNLSQPLNLDYRVNVEGLRGLLGCPPEMQPVLHLLASGANYHLPLQYRLLSFFKVFELHYEQTGQKSDPDLLQRFLPEFQQLRPEIQTADEFLKTIKHLRNRCAHIQLSSGKLGFAHPQAEAKELTEVMPIIRRMAVESIRRKYPDATLRFSSSTEDALADAEKLASLGQGVVGTVTDYPL